MRLRTGYFLLAAVQLVPKRGASRDHELLADVMRERPGKCCAICGKPVYSSSNRAKYCPVCAKQERRKQDAKRKREQYWNLRK